MRSAWVCLSVLLCLFSIGIPTSVQAGRVLNEVAVVRPFNHRLWQSVLTQYVDEQGRVDLTALKLNPRHLNQYLEQLAATSPKHHPQDFNRSEALAYWLNAHNAVALRLILDAYPVSDLKQIPGFEQSSRYRLGGEPYSLSEIREIVILTSDAPITALYGLSDYSFRTPTIYREVFASLSLGSQLEQARRVNKGAYVRFEHNAGCMGLVLNDFLKPIEEILLRRQGRLGEDAPDAQAPMTMDWAAAFLPDSPPSTYAELHKSCNHPVRYKLGDTQLRLLFPLSLNSASLLPLIEE